jgi:hypothetical protein
MVEDAQLAAIVPYSFDPSLLWHTIRTARCTGSRHRRKTNLA